MTPDQFRAALKSLGLRQRKLAEALGVHEGTISHWAAGQRPIPQYVGVVMALAAHLARTKEGRRALAAEGIALEV